MDDVINEKYEFVLKNSDKKQINLSSKTTDVTYSKSVKSWNDYSTVTEKYEKYN